MMKFMENVQEGNLDLTLTELRLWKEDGQEYVGMGRLTWSATGIHLHAVTDGGAAGFLATLANNDMSPGTVIPDDYYLRLSATTQEGWELSCDRIMPGGYTFIHGTESVKWELDSSSFLVSLDLSKEETSLSTTTTYAKVLVAGCDLRVWPRPTKTLIDNPRFGHERHSLDWLQFSLDDTTVAARRGEKGRAMLAIAGPQTDKLDRLIQAVCSTFSFVTGRLVTQIAYESQTPFLQTNKLRVPAPMLATKSHFSPLGGRVAAVPIELMLASVAKYFMTDEGRDVAELTHACIDAAGNTTTTYAMVLAAVIESLADKSTKKLGLKPTAILDLESLKEAVGTCLQERGIEGAIAARICGTISTYNSQSTSDKLYSLMEAGIASINEDEIKAWKITRNRVMHGKHAVEMNKPNAVQPALDRVNLMANMINKLVLSAAKYKGPYFDFGSWTVQNLKA